MQQRNRIFECPILFQCIGIAIAGGATVTLSRIKKRTFL